MFEANARSLCLWLTLQICTAALFACLCEAVPLSSFYAFGTAAGDTSLGSNDDDVSPLINLPTPYSYFGTSQTIAYVSIKIYILFLNRHCYYYYTDYSYYYNITTIIIITINYNYILAIFYNYICQFSGQQ